MSDVNDEAPRFLDGETLQLHVSENAATTVPFLLKEIIALDREQVNGIPHPSIRTRGFRA